MKANRTGFNRSRAAAPSRTTAPPPDSTLEFVLSSRSETEALGQSIGRGLTGGEVLALIGELGAGKTALVRGVARGLGAPPSSVTSPTFVLIHEYRGRLPLVHVDLYRLRTKADVESIGFSDYFAGETAVAVEWADRFPGLFPADRLEVRLTHRSLGTRTVRLTAYGARARALLEHVKRARRPTRRPSRSHRGKSPSRRKALQR